MAGEGTTDLAQWIERRFDMWRRNRQPLEDKWNRNWAAFKRDHTVDPKGSWKAGEKSRRGKSDSIFAVTKQKCSSAHAVITDMQFRGGEVAFMLIPGAGAAKGEEGAPAPDADALAEEIRVWEELIKQDLADCRGASQLSRGVLAAAIFGEAYFKRFVGVRAVPEMRRTASGIFERVGASRRSPGFEFKRIWNIFRDLEADELRDGDGIMERDWTAAHGLRKLLGQPLCLDFEITALLRDRTRPAEGQRSEDDSSSSSPASRDLQSRTRTVRLLEFWGLAPRALVERFEGYVRSKTQDVGGTLQTDPDEGGAFPADASVDGSDGDMVEVMCLLAENRIVRFARTKLEDRPYYRVVFEEPVDELCGVGVADNVEDEQHTLNGAVRALENNAKLVSSIIVAMKRRFIENDHQLDENGITDETVIDLTEDCPDARMALMQLKLEDASGSLLKVIDLFMGFADLSSMIPRAEQGQQSVNPQTAFELQQRLERAGKYLAGVIRNFDALIEEVVGDMYAYHLGDPDVPKGANWFQVRALGFSSFENRVTRLNHLQMLLQLVLGSDELKSIAKLRWLFTEVVKSVDLLPAQVVKTPAELEADAAQREQLLARQTAGGNPQAELARQQQIETINLLRATAAEKSSSAALKEADAEAKRTDATLKKADALGAMKSQAPEPVPGAPAGAAAAA